MASNKPARVLVTGAAGKIELVHAFAGGDMLGPDQSLILHLQDSPSAAEALNGVKMELVDGAFPLLKGVVTTTNVVEACTRVNIAVVHVGFSRKKGTEVPFYESLALELGKHAAADCEIWAVGDLEYAKELFSASTMSLKDLATRDSDLAYSERLNVPANRVENANIFGNRPSTPYPDTNFATVKTPNGKKSVHELPADGARIDEEFIIKASARSSAMSAASSACDCIPDWVIGTPVETLVSMGEDSDGSHSVPAGRNGTRSIVEDLDTPTPAIFQSEVEGKIKQPGVSPEMISNLLTKLENRAGDALHHYASTMDEFDRYAEHVFENLCNKIEFLQREIANLQSNLAISRVEIANLQSSLAIALVYLHGAFQAIAMVHQ